MKIRSIKIYFEKENIRYMLKDLAYLTIGSILFSFSMTAFMTPSKLAPGGTSGLASIIKNYFHLKISVQAIFVCLNIPLFISGFKYLGGFSFILKTFYVLFLTWILNPLFKPFEVGFTQDIIINSILLTMFVGIGAGLIIKGGGTSGGTVILAKLLHYLLPILTLGQWLIVSDGFVVAISYIAFHDISITTYSGIVVLFAGIIVDFIVLGSKQRVMILIKGKKTDEIRNKILEVHGREPVFECEMLTYVINKRNLMNYKSIIHGVEKDASVFVTVLMD